MLKLIIAEVGSEEQLEKEAFRMAAGGEQGCSLASDPGAAVSAQAAMEGVARGPGLSAPGNRYTSVCCVPLVIPTVSSSGRRRMGYPWASWIRYRGLPTSSRNS